MNGPKQVASLSAGLLARKGEARPALRPQLHIAARNPSPVAEQQARIAAAFETPSRAPTSAKERSAFTLRLDPERHLRLRLIGARTHRSAQSLLIEALDRLLDEMAPDAGCSCGRVKR